MGKGPAAILLKAGREKSLLRRHPWIFSGAIERVDGAPVSGDTLPVRDASGNFLAWAAYNPGSQITARVWSWREEEIIDAEFFRSKISNALAARSVLLPIEAPHLQCAFRQVGRNSSTGAEHALRIPLLAPTPLPLAGEGANVKSNLQSLRLIHAESDGLPGVIVDKYGDVLVMQIGSAGGERWRDTCAETPQNL